MDEQNIEIISVTDIDEQFIISVNKFIVLSVLTFGVYEIWWAYKAWRFYQQKEKLDIMPALRALLGVFFLIPLFNKIKRSAVDTGVSTDYNSVLLYIGYLVLNIFAQSETVFWFLSFISIVFLIPPFKTFNHIRLNSTEFSVTEQKSFNAKQTVLIIMGAICWGVLLMVLTDK